VRSRPMIIQMKTTSTLTATLDRRLRELVERQRGSGHSHGSRRPRSTTPGWLGAVAAVVVTVQVVDLTQTELRREILKLRRCC
jgi:hypothetical protein